MTALRRSSIAAATLALALASHLVGPQRAFAEAATWRSEQPSVPGSALPAALGAVGDIEFWAPDRGLLITQGEPPTVPAGIWAYNGVQWHELASVCGATDGRIAWASPDEFWTVSDGRAGQANEISGNGTEKEVSIADNTLCHFAHGSVVASYAHPANRPDSYLAMRAAACLSPSDCWFGGEPLAEPQVGSFHLQWDGSVLENAPYLGEGHAVEDISAFEGSLYESVAIARADRVVTKGSAVPVLHRINPPGAATPIEPEEGPFDEGLPLYEAGELPNALGALSLSAAAGRLWAAAGVNTKEPVQGGDRPGQVTVAQLAGGEWTQLVGPQHPLAAILPPARSEEEWELLSSEHAEGRTDAAKSAVVSAIAAEPGGAGAWLALAPPHQRPGLRAVLVHLSATGAVSGEQTLPSSEEEQQGIGPKGSAAKLACPAAGDCWLATTQGWLFHLAPQDERLLPRDQQESEYFAGLITYRPPDQGLPQVPPDAPPEDDSGLTEEVRALESFPEPKPEQREALVTVPLLSDLHSALLHGSTLQLRFHLAVKARVRLVAKRRGTTVAATPTRVLKAGNRTLLLRLDPRRWPTKLSLQTHALAPLPTEKSGSANVGTISTGFAALPGGELMGRQGLLP